MVEAGRLIGCDRGVVPAALAVKATLPKSFRDSVSGKQLFDELIIVFAKISWGGMALPLRYRCCCRCSFARKTLIFITLLS